jgi:hypothetical protein
MKLKDAEFYVNEGRAEWVGRDQLRLVLAHPKNRAAAERARGWELDYRPNYDGDRITQELMLFGTNPPTDEGGRFRRRGGGLAAADHARTSFEESRPRGDRLIARRMAPDFCTRADFDILTSRRRAAEMRARRLED